MFIQDSILKTKDIELINSNFENSHPIEIISWAWSFFGSSIIASSSFQSTSLPLLHIISQVAPELPIIFIDTGFHFPETLAFRDHIQSILDIKIITIKPELSTDQFLERYGELYQHHPDACCYLNKIEPFQIALQGKKAWISGISRDQTASRKNSSIIGWHPILPIIKINPMACFTAEQVQQYIDKFNLPRHPLNNKGYSSIGCWPCTSPIEPGEDERSGRWRGIDKFECGIHFP